MGVTVNDKAVRKMLSAIGSPTKVANIIRPAMTMGAEVIMTNAKKRAPVDTGALRSSGRVHRGFGVNKVSLILGFHTNYAIYVHEDLTANHPVGEAKFLEKAVNANVKKIERLIGAAITEAVK